MAKPVTTPRRIVVTGASGNVGSGVLRALARHVPAAEIVGVCRRPPTVGELYDTVHWHAVDLSAPDAAARLAPAMAGADVVIHLALALYPVHDNDYLYRANVVGTQAVLRAMTDAGIAHLVYASSLGVYAPGPRTPVDETYPATGQPTSVYSRHKVMVEALLDDYQQAHPDVVISRFRPTVVAQRETASMVSRLYLGPLLPRFVLELMRRRALPVLPLPMGLALQFVHTDDVGEAAVRLMRCRSTGSYNVAADPLGDAGLAALVGGRPVPIDARLVRRVVVALNSLRVIAVTPGWYDVATNTPLMDTTKLRNETGWAPAHSSADSARELIEGLADGAVGFSPALGYDDRTTMTKHTAVDALHDASLTLWLMLVAARALGASRPGWPEAVVIGTNLAAGTPAALARLTQRRRDPVALLAPPTVGAAVLATRRGGWAPVLATAVLGAFAVAERRRGR
ncbi:NAD-dependent epimerase/dehydratase family protein [Mycolicibacterium bacteremicum]|uniref:NAD-dependent epimerase/dehydratase family protein n=1 Tax=Mycolicibacterium bacteremicum TaxID=564198 RepID=UPI0026F33FFA|nr:NAD-dependent epimerase/dehydratase family protein [Mycolicibacterium bacteremicum]